MNANKTRKIERKAKAKRRAQARRGRLIAGLILHGWGPHKAGMITNGVDCTIVWKEKGGEWVVSPQVNMQPRPVPIGDDWSEIPTWHLRIFHAYYVLGQERVTKMLRDNLRDNLIQGEIGTFEGMRFLSTSYSETAILDPKKLVTINMI